MFDAIILAGGLGTRLREVVADVPKPLAKINGRPFLDLLVQQVTPFATNLILSLGYQAEKIMEHYRNEPFTFCCEGTPLGTGGAIKKALLHAQSEEVLVMNGDSFFGVDFNDLFAFHQKKNADITIACKKVENISRYGSIVFDEAHRISGFYEKEASLEPGWINGGIYLMKKKLLDAFSKENFSLENDAFPELIKKNAFAYLSQAKFIDIGTRESFSIAQSFFNET